MNAKITSILFDEGIYKVKHRNDGSAKPTFELKGNPDSAALCLFINEDFSHPRDEELVLAENILKAINIQKDEYAWHYSKDSLAELNFNHENVFIFHSGAQLSIESFPFNKLVKKGNTNVVRTHSLADLISDEKKKAALWNELKIIINK